MTDYEKKEFERELQQKKVACEIIQKLSRTSNNMTFNPREFAELLATQFIREHRTLQQGMIKVIAEFISIVAEQHTDLRNQAAIDWCKEVKKIEAVFPFI